jgi:hypothetical protein
VMSGHLGIAICWFLVLSLLSSCAATNDEVNLTFCLLILEVHYSFSKIIKFLFHPRVWFC